jgi:hypothetical protein
MISPWWFLRLFPQGILAVAALTVAGCGGRLALETEGPGTSGRADSSPDKAPDGTQTDGGDATDAPGGGGPMLKLLAGGLKARPVTRSRSRSRCRTG